MVLMHDEHGYKDDGVYSKMHPESKYGIGNVLPYSAGLSFGNTFVDFFNWAHVAVTVPSNIETPEGSSQGHRYSFATATNSQVNQHWVETIEVTHYFGCLFVLSFVRTTPILKYFVHEDHGSYIKEGNDYFAKTLMEVVTGRHNQCKERTVAIGVSLVGRWIGSCVEVDLVVNIDDGIEDPVVVIIVSGEVEDGCHSDDQAYKCYLNPH